VFDKTRKQFAEQIADPIRNTVKLAMTALIVAVLALITAVFR